jgi:hypothetical protein
MAAVMEEKALSAAARSVAARSAAVAVAVEAVAAKFGATRAAARRAAATSVAARAADARLVAAKVVTAAEQMRDAEPPGADPGVHSSVASDGVRGHPYTPSDWLARRSMHGGLPQRLHGPHKSCQCPASAAWYGAWAVQAGQNKGHRKDRPRLGASERTP